MSYNSVVLKNGSAFAAPPVTNTLPFVKSTVLCTNRVPLRLAVTVQEFVAGSYSSTLAVAEVSTPPPRNDHFAARKQRGRMEIARDA